MLPLSARTDFGALNSIWHIAYLTERRVSRHEVPCFGQGRRDNLVRQPGDPNSGTRAAPYRLDPAVDLPITLPLEQDPSSCKRNDLAL